MFRIEMFGDIRIVRNHDAVNRFPTQKSASLLAYLAYFPDRRHPREVLATLLWPDAAPQDGRNSLKQEIATLRRLFRSVEGNECSPIASDRLQVWFDETIASSDTTEFQMLLRKAARESEPATRCSLLMQAAALYKGDLTPGLFEDWAVRERERLSQSYHLALRQISRDLRISERWDEALDYARRSVAADPLCEASCEELMRICISRDRPAEAIREFQRLERALQSELDATPQGALRSLAESCRGEVSAAAARGNGYAPGSEGSGRAARDQEKQFCELPDRELDCGPAQTTPPPDDDVDRSRAASTSAVAPLPSCSHGARVMGYVEDCNRHWRRGGAIAALLLFATLAFLAPRLNGQVSVSHYRIQDLGTLPGFSESTAVSINDVGQVVGYANNAESSSADEQAILWDIDGGTRSLSGLPPGYNVAARISSNGTIVGGREAHSFIAHFSGNLHGEPPTLAPLAGVSFVNDRGQVAGYMRDENGLHAAIWSLADGVTLLDAPRTSDGKECSSATGILQDGSVVGVSGTKHRINFIWTRTGGFRPLPVNSAGDNCIVAVNIHGDMAGTVGDDCDSVKPCLFDRDGTAHRIPVYSGSTASVSAMNSSCQIVGICTAVDGRHRAYLWTRERGTIDLNSTLPPGSGWELTDACGINDQGQIVGQGIHGNRLRAYILSPTAPPQNTK